MVSPFIPKNSHHTEVAESGRASCLDHNAVPEPAYLQSCGKAGSLLPIPSFFKVFYFTNIFTLSAMGLFRISGSGNQVPLPPECPVLVLRGCHNKAPLGGLKQLTFMLSQFWRLEVQSQGVGRATFPLKPVEENPSWHLVVCWQSLECLACSPLIFVSIIMVFSSPVSLCLS